MPTITFNAFSFLHKKLKAKKIDCSEVSMQIDEGTCARDLVRMLNLLPEEVEVVLINGKAAPMETLINDQDRVALVPPGTPGPYRVLLGFKNKENSSG